jgi:hypothetical protein
VSYTKSECEKIKKMIADFTAKKLAEGPEACHRYLIELGTHDKDGNLTPQYGGR